MKKMLKKMVATENTKKRGRPRKDAAIRPTEEANVKKIVKTRGRPKKVQATVPEVKSEVKNARKTRKQMAKKVEANLEKNVAKNKVIRKAKDLNKTKTPAKPTMKSALKLFGNIKKDVSKIKKATAGLGKFISEAHATGDQAYVERVYKLFGRLGFTKTETGISLTTTGKVKLPKIKKAKEVKAEKPEVSEEKPKRKYARRAAKSTTVEATATEAAPTEEPAPETENDAEPAVPAPVIAEEQPTETELLDSTLPELNDQEDLDDDEDAEEEVDHSRDRETLFDGDEDLDARAEFEEQMRENGDWN